MLNALVLSEITGFALERWRSGRLAAGSTPGTVNRDLAVVKAALARAVEWGMLTTHPLAPVRLSKLDRGGVVRYLSHEEETRLRDALTARDTKRRAERATANDWRRARGYALWPETISRRWCCGHSTPVSVVVSCSGCDGPTST
jgi:hypothetical protein